MRDMLCIALGHRWSQCKPETASKCAAGLPLHFRWRVGKPVPYTFHLGIMRTSLFLKFSSGFLKVMTFDKICFCQVFPSFPSICNFIADDCCETLNVFLSVKEMQKLQSFAENISKPLLAFTVRHGSPRFS